MRRFIAAAAMVAIPAALHAQSLNIDFGPATSAPPASYAGVGLAGAWNSVEVLQPFVRAPLVGLDGQPIAAKVYMFGGTSMLAADDPGTSGDEAALMDDMLLSYNEPVDACIWVEDLELGDYIVITYALTPSAPSVISPVRVDYATTGSMPVGGTWPGGHEFGVTYARHRVTTYGNGKVALHSGTYGGYFQSGINGVQLIYVPEILGVGPAPSRGNALRLLGPNPGDGGLEIELSLASAIASGDLEIADVSGRRVWASPTGRRDAGPHTLRWDGRGLDGGGVPAGVYFARIRAIAEDGTRLSLGPIRLVRVR